MPRILLDGSDSVGAWVALARVYLNIGTYSERWNQLHNPLVGFTPQRPFTIADCREHSAYWHATETRVGPMRDYFLAATPPMPLLAATDNGSDPNPPPRVDISKLARGRKVFAHNCIVCHSSLQPETLFVENGNAQFAAARGALMVEKGAAPAFAAQFKNLAKARRDALAEWAGKGEFWDHDPGQWLARADYRAWAETVVEQENFWKNNYLSTDYRVPITLVRTNSARAMATNAMTGRMWQDFSSEDYRRLPSVGAIDFFNPYPWKDGAAGRERIFGKRFPYPFIDKGNGEEAFMPAQRAPEGVAEGGGGPGFYRVPTLISIWATAPLLHNNSLGLFNNDPSVRGRLAAFDDAIHKLLWPERRLQSSSYNNATPERLKQDHGLIWRTTEPTYINLPAKFVPAQLSRVPPLMSALSWLSDRLRLPGPPWVPSALFLAIAFALLLWAARWKTARYVAYLFVCFAFLAGIIRYFESGGLGDLRIGPFPKGTPVNLLANLNPEADPKKLAKTLHLVISKLGEIESRHLDENEKQRVMREEIAPALMEVSKCPDFVMDKGHYYEWFKTMTDEDKEALIELLKTF